MAQRAPCVRLASACAAFALTVMVRDVRAQAASTGVTAVKPAALTDTVPVPAHRALRELLADASVRNVLPSSLVAYKARVETEIAVLLRREEGTEVATMVEQVASALRWTRSGYYDQHVIGYRAQQTGASLSMLSFVQTGWLQPALYGNRLRVVRRSTQGGRPAIATSSAASEGTPPRSAPPVAPQPSARRDGSDTLPAIHPLATDRDRYYRYTGGDTVVTMRVGNRAIPIVHVRVQPRTNVTQQVLLFDGELELDASRGALVRMRGSFVRLNRARSSLTESLIEAVAFVEYENAERLGEYWLPTKQRIELQAASPLFGEGRAVIRIVSRFTEMNVNDTTLSAATLARVDSTRLVGRRKLSYARGDSLSSYGAWRGGIGEITAGMHSDDFDDVGPDRWRRKGAPRVDVSAPRASDVFHFNRVEGAYTGLGVKMALRDLAPGVIVRANAGWAWNERTARGRLSVERTSGATTVELRAGRSLDNTNDFRIPFDSGNTLGALFGSQDPYDYVDRRSATMAVVQRFGARTLQLRTELGVADDRYRAATYVRSPLGGPAYRPNRGVDEGGYVRSAALLEWHPDVSAEFVRPGIGARVSYERGDGTLSFQRIEARLFGRRPFGPFVVAARADIGTVLGDHIPAQQLFELGENQNLPGYLDKEFAGTRAAVLRGTLLYKTHWWQAPIRIGRFLLPAVAPGASIGIQSGWTEIPSAAAQASVLRLGVLADSTGALVPVARATGGVRASVSAGLRFFGGSVFVGVTRPVDHAAKWKAQFAIGQQW